MTKAEIVDQLCAKVGGFSKKEASEFVDLVFDTIKDELERGDRVKLTGFGNFLVRDKPPRPGRNPRTGEEIEIEARRVLVFKPSAALKDAINGD